MAYRVEVDYNFDCPLQEFLTHMTDYKAKLVKWEAIGPGGGNPCVFLEFTDQDDAMAFLRFHDADHDNIAWLRTRIKRV